MNEPKADMIATYDAGEYDDIHPQDKMLIGKRLALMVAHNAGENVIAHGQKYKNYKVDGNSIVVSFDVIHGGLISKEVCINKSAKIAPGKDPEAYVASASVLTGFLICGEDKVFHEAKTVIKNNKVIVSSPKVTKPIAVRYAWKTFALANLYNKAGLPAYPFRTDDFPRPELFKKKKKRKR